eukprot:m.10196 g.10196  ORF g.10196 m.10196 type:complete len:93 (-) comp9611_c0_seq1:21-299(-)
MAMAISANPPRTAPNDNASTSDSVKAISPWLLHLLPTRRRTGHPRTRKAQLAERLQSRLELKIDKKLRQARIRVAVSLEEAEQRVVQRRYRG